MWDAFCREQVPDALQSSYEKTQWAVSISVSIQAAIARGKLRHEFSLGDHTTFITEMFSPFEQSDTADSSEMLIWRA